MKIKINVKKTLARIVLTIVILLAIYWAFVSPIIEAITTYGFSIKLVFTIVGAYVILITGAIVCIKILKWAFKNI